MRRPRALERTWHRGMPATPVAPAAADVARTLPFDELRRALAEAEYRRLLDLRAVQSVLKRGQPGSAALRWAMSHHLPQLARTLSVLEERFLQLCEARGVPLPEVNVSVRGLMVDCLVAQPTRDRRARRSRGPRDRAAMERDRERDLDLRTAGYLVLRYTWQQVTERPGAVADDLRRALAGRQARRFPFTLG